MMRFNVTTADFTISNLKVEIARLAGQTMNAFGGFRQSAVSLDSSMKPIPSHVLDTFHGVDGFFLPGFILGFSRVKPASKCQGL